MKCRPRTVVSDPMRPDTTGFAADPSFRRDRPVGSLRLLRRGLCALVCASAVLAAPSVSFADSLAKEASIGMGSFFASTLYAPCKLGYAFGGMIVGGLAWMFSGGDSDVAGVILTPSLRGSYVLTPNMLQGKDEIEFFGRSPEYRSEDDDESLAVADSRW